MIGYPGVVYCFYGGLAGEVALFYDVLVCLVGWASTMFERLEISWATMSMVCLVC